MGVLKSTNGQDGSFEITSDLSDYQFHCVKLSSGVLTASFTKGDPVLGVLQEYGLNGATNKQCGRVRGSGFTRARAGGTISEGDYCVVDTDGELITDDAANQFVVGQALEDAVDQDEFGLRLILAPTLTA